MKTETLTVSDALRFLFEFHLKGKASERPLRSNRAALEKSIGEISFKALTEPDLTRHVNLRKSGALTDRPASPQTIRHDLGLFTLCFNTMRRWKKRGYVIGGLDFATLDLPHDNPCEDIKRPKCKPRKRDVAMDAFARWIEHAPERLVERTFFALDTGLNPIELKRLKTAAYNPRTDCLDIQRGKTGEVGSLPVTNRCRAIIVKAIKDGREFVLDWTNEQGDIENTRRESGVYFWFGRDLRCTYYNQILKSTGRDYRAAQRAMLHSDPKTGIMHYEIDEGKELRLPIADIEKNFSTETSSENRK